MRFIEVIDDTLDMSIDITCNLRSIKSSFHSSFESVSDMACSQEDNSRNYETEEFSFINNIPSHESQSRKRLIKLDMPKYCPPSDHIITALDHISSILNVGRPKISPKKPDLPKAKTNTKLSNYIHRLYVYEHFLWEQQQMRDRFPDYGSTVNSHIKLKHPYDTSLSREVSKKISRDWY
ncbi:Piso0_005249 [Millerozyma farinosa CBS 7064]|uniref:Piso0_005249 protein n=1 Tax=Pichia sorbitophila (strain ATCC MYA-4447 / BCRC 22081 / CBS 7064 / NBRC 10061 / NRRL Y-12695) TaxID=559304 RepID=G8Y4L5_PICSO|nr:Piso0_005249 [Millerozyma farinosa CBS 7064]